MQLFKKSYFTFDTVSHPYFKQYFLFFSSYQIFTMCIYNVSYQQQPKLHFYYGLLVTFRLNIIL